MSDRRAPAVVVSAGFNKTHMTTAAREACDRGQLALAITGAYPTPALQRMARRTGLARRRTVSRWLERDERIPRGRLRTLTLPELVCDGARRLLAHRRATHALAEQLVASMWRLYGWRAGRELGRISPRPDVYHFRAGYGQGSLRRARELGIHVLCDQALVHPSTLDALVDGRGRLPAGPPAPSQARLSAVDRAVLDDLHGSDSVLVNSDFVKQSFLALGWPAERVHVIYLGVDENFLRGVPATVRRPQAGPLRLLFAGRFERRKGADALVEALSRLPGPMWELSLAGPILPDVGERHREFLADPRVTVLGSVGRDELARRMLAAEVLVLASYAEGSARVVFEALACGCYVITTPNSGTIVEDGVHGALVAPGDPAALAQAIVSAHADRARLARIANHNVAVVHERYRQRHYGENLGALYARLTSGQATAPVPA